MLGVVFLLAGCRRGSEKPREFGYVAVSQVALRDRVATVYNKTGVVKNGEPVEILERSKRFVRVRSPRNEEGWVEQRYLVSQQVCDGFRKLASQHASKPVQAPAATRADVNMHLTPERESEHLYQLKEGEKVELLLRGTSEKPVPQGAVPPPQAPRKKQEGPPMEDWWLVRDSRRRVGWVLARLVDIDIPLDVAQYAEGQRIVAYFVLNRVDDGDKKVLQYLVALTEPRDGLPFDYNQVRVFTWNLKRHRYETAYRERRLPGALPIRVGTQPFGKEGTLPVFLLRLKDESGNIVDRTYKLNGVMVRRLLAPGEPARPLARTPARRKAPHR